MLERLRPLGVWQSNVTPGTPLGTTVTTGATAHTMGAWTTLIASLSFPVTHLRCAVGQTAASATDRSVLIDLGVGQAGSERVVAQYLDVGTALIFRSYLLPIRLRQGERLAARAQSNVTSLNVSVMAWVSPGMDDVGRGSVVTYGAVPASSRGTLVTMGNGAFGAWTSLGTTSQAHVEWLIGCDQGGDTTLANTFLIVELGIGPAGSQQPIAKLLVQESNVEDLTYYSLPQRAAVPAGTSLWARIAGNSTTEQRGVIAYGLS